MGSTSLAKPQVMYTLVFFKVGHPEVRDQIVIRYLDADNDLSKEEIVNKVLIQHFEAIGFCKLKQIRNFKKRLKYILFEGHLQKAELIDRLFSGVNSDGSSVDIQSSK